MKLKKSQSSGNLLTFFILFSLFQKSQERKVAFLTTGDKKDRLILFRKSGTPFFLKGVPMNRTGIVKDRRYMDHVMDPGHPESPARLQEIYHMIEEEEMKGRVLGKVTPRPTTREELEMVHSPSYIDLVASTTGKPYVRLDMDTMTCAKIL